MSFQTKLVQKNGEVSLTGKAYNNRVITGWLAEELRSAASRGVVDGDTILSLTHLCVTLVFHYLRSKCQSGQSGPWN